MIAPSDRLEHLPLPLLVRVSQDRDEKLRRGVDGIDAGVGSCDMRPTRLANHALKAAPDDPAPNS